MSDSLSKLFGSPARVKLLRLFLFNPRGAYTLADASTRARVTPAEARREFRLLEGIGLIAKAPRGKGMRFTLQPNFEYVLALQSLLINTPSRADDIVKLLRGVGSMKLVILSGLFVNETEESLDILVVGDKINERMLRERIKKLESEIGKELRFALLTSENFFYRMNMNDKLVRDVLDYPHRVVLDKLNIGIK
jgi:hypothetical protein